MAADGAATEHAGAAEGVCEQAAAANPAFAQASMTGTAAGNRTVDTRTLGKT